MILLYCGWMLSIPLVFCYSSQHGAACSFLSLILLFTVSILQLLAERARMGRNASISTQAILNSLPDEQSPTQALIDRIQAMFRSPNEHVAYLKSEQFAKDLVKLNKKVKGILEDEPRCVFLQSPAYVFGDIHGNLEDLHFFSDNVWNLGMALTAGNFVFLGDYVDRGMSCLEVVAYLLAMKLMLPQKVFLLRGNHETRDVNGWEEHYGNRSFIYQCRERFGDDLGYKVWELTNSTFDRMPLAAVIDQDIFCVHGGIPRPISDSSVEGGRIKDILNVSKVSFFDLELPRCIQTTQLIKVNISLLKHVQGCWD